MTKRPAMQITEHELRTLTRDLDEMHHETLPQMREALNRFADDARSGAMLSRRRLFAGVSLAAGGAALAACSSSKSTKTEGQSGQGNTTTGGSAGSGGADLQIAALAASLENLAVQTYQAGLDAAQAGKLGTVPPAVATFATTAQAHHKAHAQAWNSVLTGAHMPAVTGIDKTVQESVVAPGFAKVADVAGLAKLALGLEDAAAATYLAAAAALSSRDAVKVAATIQPVEMQHSAILHFVLGEYPVPAAFATTDGARSPGDKIG